MLDDDSAFLEMMALVLPTNWPVRLMLRPTECIAQLIQQDTLRDSEHWRQQEIIDRWRKIRMSLLQQILDYWSASNTRFSLVKALVLDYSMPAMNGVKVLQALDGWTGARILLTGRADEQLAVDAFNCGLINQFIPKQATDMVQQVLANLQHMQAAAEPRIAQIWRPTLSPRQYALLNLPSVSQDLARFSAREWIEHIVVGAPFGMLGRDAAGNSSWLQLEAANDLDELAELVDGLSLSNSELDEIRKGRQLPDFELRQALGLTKPLQLRPAFPIGHEEPLLGAVFPIDASEKTSHNSFQRFMAQQPRRQVEN